MVFYRVSQDSATGSDKDSGVGHESPRGGSRDKPSSLQSRGVREEPTVEEDTQEEEEEEEVEPKVYAFLVEDCILKAFQGKSPNCPDHGELMLGK